MTPPDMSLRDSLQLPRARLKNPKYYMVDDELVVDHVIRYEHLGADLAVVMSHLGLASALGSAAAPGVTEESEILYGRRRAGGGSRYPLRAPRCRLGGGDVPSRSCQRARICGCPGRD